MSAVQDTVRQRNRGLRGLVAWPSYCPLLSLPLPLLGLAGAAASIMFRALSRVPAQGQAGSWLTYPGPHGWFARPQQAAVAVACAVAFAVLNARDRVCLSDPADAAPDASH